MNKHEAEQKRAKLVVEKDYLTELFEHYKSTYPYRGGSQRDHTAGMMLDWGKLGYANELNRIELELSFVNKLLGKQDD